MGRSDEKANVPKTYNPQSDSHVTNKGSQERILKKRGYTLGRLLGEGSYAKVYLAEFQDPETESRRQKLACKVINGNNAPKDFLRKFFPREVEIMSKVNHQYLIRVHSILQRKQKYFIFMQYAENGDMLDFIRSNGAVRERQARVWFAQVLKGLKYLHERDIAHRDMKCENLLLTAAYNIKISDFGFARYTVDDNGKQVLSDTFCGSVSYASPEIIRGVLYDPKGADLWSIGIILYIMLNKAMPFDDSSLRKLYDAQMNRNWKVRSKLKDVLSNDVKAFLYILLEPYPEKRKSLDQLWVDPWIQKSSNPEIASKERDRDRDRYISTNRVMPQPATTAPGTANQAPHDQAKMVPLPQNMQITDVDTNEKKQAQQAYIVTTLDGKGVKDQGEIVKHGGAAPANMDKEMLVKKEGPVKNNFLTSTSRREANIEDTKSDSSIDENSKSSATGTTTKTE